MVGMAHIGFGTLWVVWGMIGIAIHFIFGAVVLRRRMMRLAALASSSAAAEADVLAAARSLGMAQLAYLLILASVVGAMVLKPT